LLNHSTAVSRAVGLYRGIRANAEQTCLVRPSVVTGGCCGAEGCTWPSRAWPMMPAVASVGSARSGCMSLRGPPFDLVQTVAGRAGAGRGPGRRTGSGLRGMPHKRERARPACLRWAARHRRSFLHRQMTTTVSRSYRSIADLRVFEMPQVGGGR
jgi:hypothetical protein